MSISGLDGRMGGESDCLIKGVAGLAAKRAATMSSCRIVLLEGPAEALPEMWDALAFLTKFLGRTRRSFIIDLILRFEEWGEFVVGMFGRFGGSGC